MQNDAAHKRHPSQQELTLHAEAVLEATGPIDGLIAAHVASCPVCTSEVNAICGSLGIIKSAPLIEPSFKSQTTLMMRVRKERRTRERLRKGRRGALRTAGGLAYAAAIIVIAGLAFAAALGGAPESPGNAIAWTEMHSAPPGDMTVATDTAQKEAVADAFATVRSLTNAVQRSGMEPLTPAQQKQKRTVDALSADMAAAQEALTRNPGNERASAVMNASLEKQAQTLRGLYIQGSF